MWRETSSSWLYPRGLQGPAAGGGVPHGLVSVTGCDTVLRGLSWQPPGREACGASGTLGVTFPEQRSRRRGSRQLRVRPLVLLKTALRYWNGHWNRPVSDGEEIPVGNLFSLQMASGGDTAGNLFFSDDRRRSGEGC